jgi:hypothetical protein
MFPCPAVNDNHPDPTPARLQAAFALRYAPTPRDAVLLLTRVSPRAPATPRPSRPARRPPQLTRPRACA